MYNAQQGIKWYEIRNKIIYDPELNKDNAFDKTTKALLATGIDINTKDLKGETILTIATEPRTIDIGIINAIIAAGADPNVASKHKTTALHRAALNGRLDIVKALLEKGADVHALDQRRETALHRAADAGCTEVVKFLLSQKGVKVDAVSQSGYTALHLAASYGRAEATLALLKAGANANAKNYTHEVTPLRTIIDSAFLSQEAVQRAQRALEVAAQRVQEAERVLETAQRVQEVQEAAQEVQEVQETAQRVQEAAQRVQEAAQRVQKAAQNIQNVQKVIKILLMYGADISSKDKWGDTPIGQATGDIKRFMEQALNELHRMKDEKIGYTNISYDQFRQATNDRLTRYVRNINVCTTLENGEHKEKYPIYASKIDNQLEIGKERAKLEDAATIVMKRFIAKDKEKEVILHEESCRKVATYLKDADLKTVLNSGLFPNQ